MMTGSASMHSVRRGFAVAALCTGALAGGPGVAGGLFLYEVGTADVGLASAGYGARAQDASTVLTNPAGLTRLEGNQVLLGGQALWSNLKFSRGAGTSPGLGRHEGGYAVGADGWFPGGGGFMSYSLSPELKLGLGVTGNFGLGLDYDDDWVGRYYVQEAALVGLSLLPTIAYKVTDTLSFGASLNAMYGKLNQQVAINNLDPAYSDGQLKLNEGDWGWGANLGLLYEINARTRLGLTWGSQVNLDFAGPAKFSGLAPLLERVLDSRGLLGAKLKVGIKVPQQVMASLFTQLDDRWALLGSVGWQQWSKFGLVQIGIDDSSNPQSLTADLDFDNTWHVALGAQYRLSEPWLLTFGIAYDSSMYKGSEVSPLLPVGSAWRFGAGAQQQLSKRSYWGVAAEYLYGGTLDVDLKGKPVALGGRGSVGGAYEDIGVFFVTAYYSWRF